MKRLLLICGLAVVLVPAALAGNSFPLAFILYDAHITVSDTNLNRCVRGESDYIIRIAGINSVLASGATVTDSWCVLEDTAPHQVASELRSSSSTLQVVLSAGASSVQVTPVFDKRLRLWVYRGCLQVPPSSVEQQAGVSLTSTDRRGVDVKNEWGVSPGVC